MAGTADDGWLQMLRMHRHDMLNGLQLVSGYLQLDKPERALQSLERMANWLRTVSWIQAATESTEWTAWFQASHVTPHVLLRNRPEVTALSQQQDMSLAAAWRWLEEIAALHGILEIGLDAVGKTEENGSIIELTVDAGETVADWWSERPGLATIKWSQIDRQVEQ